MALSSLVSSRTTTLLVEVLSAVAVQDSLTGKIGSKLKVWKCGGAVAVRKQNNKGNAGKDTKLRVVGKEVLKQEILSQIGPYPNWLILSGDTIAAVR